MKKICLFVILLSIPLVNCGPKKENGIKRSSASFTYKGEIKPGKWLYNLKVYYTAQTGKSKYAIIQIYFPKGYKQGQELKTIITLHGYQENQRTWEIKTPIEKYADEYSFAIVCPNMKTTVYESAFFPETKKQFKWGGIPGGTFIAVNLVNYLRKTFNLATEKDTTAILGAKMGGRGALLLTAQYPASFKTAAGLTGIYDKSLMSRSYKFVSIYGSYKDFKARWKKYDNLLKLSANLKNTPVYIWHGKKDFAIPPEQSIIIALKLRKYKNITYIQHKRSIEWRYFAYKALPDVMKFFNEKLKK